jgi:hypothetical protein
MHTRIRTKPARSGTVKPQPKVMLYITRWLQREPHRNFHRMIERADEWGPVLNILANGYGPLDEASGRVRTVDTRRLGGNLGIPAMTALAFDDALMNGADICGLIDDDACFVDPPAAIRMFHEGYRAGAGAWGPITQHRHMAVYGSDPDFRSALISKEPYTTFGCQMYSCDALSRSRRIWHPMENALLFTSDAPMYMLLSALGHPLYEFWEPGYRHRCSGSATSEATRGTWNETVYRRDMQLCVVDTYVSQRYLAMVPGSDTFLRLFDTRRTDGYKKLIKKCASVDTSGWSTLIPENWRTADEMYAERVDEMREAYLDEREHEVRQATGRD